MNANKRGELATKLVLALLFVLGLGLVFNGLQAQKIYNQSGFSAEGAFQAIYRLSEDAQKLIMQGFMHSVFANMKEIPWGSVSTEDLIQKDLGVDWENAYHNREALNKDWTEIVNR